MSSFLWARLARSCGHTRRVCFTHRFYATRKDTSASSLLSQALDQKQHAQTGNADSVGPFQLGISQQALRKGEKVKKWSELSTAGKVTRTAARTSNLTVILLGAGLSALLVYSLTSELFSKNSATVLYNDACGRIQASPQLAKYLHAPLKFHNNPPTSVRPRHRSRVTSQIVLDASGREHMFLHFYVQGSPPGSKTDEDSTYFESFTNWFKEQVTAMSELTVEDVKEWGTESVERAKGVFRYLSGKPVPPIPRKEDHPATETNGEKESGGWGASAKGMFGALLLGSLKGAVSMSGDGSGVGQKETWTEGEVHADLVRNNEGYFVFRYLLVDIPNSRVRYPSRVFVERAAGVRENEPVMRWDSA